MFDRVLRWFGRRIAIFLEKPTQGYQPYTRSDPATLRRNLQPGDILLVEGNQRVSAAIKYLTQSTWSHAAMYVGDALGPPKDVSEPLMLVEVNVETGAIAVPLSKYQNFNTRICRPVRLTVQDRKKVVAFMIDRLGTDYDTKNIIDLLRYLLPNPPVPVRWRRRMIAMGSGDPSRAICSTLIAQAFQQVKYPILPLVQSEDDDEKILSPFYRKEILHIRHHSLFAPRDFDISPFFAIVKPTIESGFDYKKLNWHDEKQDLNTTK